jgi:hypothetical protein
MTDFRGRTLHEADANRMAKDLVAELRTEANDNLAKLKVSLNRLSKALYREIQQVEAEHAHQYRTRV